MQYVFFPPISDTMDFIYKIMQFFKNIFFVKKNIKNKNLFQLWFPHKCPIEGLLGHMTILSLVF